MTKELTFFKGLKLNKYYKVLLYTFGIILILSFILEFKNVDLISVRTISYWIIFASVGIWIFEDLFDMLLAFVKSSVSWREQNTVAFLLVILYYGIQIAVWVYIMRNILKLF